MSDPAAIVPEPLANLGLLLGLVKSELVRAIERELAATGIDLRFSQAQTLLRLRHTGPLGAGELARSLCHDGGAMTRLLDQLEQRGWLRRQPDPQDRRALRIELTAEGVRLCERLADAIGRALDRALAALEDEERRRLADALQRILATLRAPA